MDIKSYPTKKVILTYSLLGGLVGGLIYSLAVGSVLLVEQVLHQSFKTDTTAFMDVLFGFAGILMVSFIVGFIPALLTGISIAIKKIRLIKKLAYLRLALIGFLATVPISTVLILLIAMWSNGLSRLTPSLITENILTILVVSSIGGLSSVIVGKLVLPKS